MMPSLATQVRMASPTRHAWWVRTWDRLSIYLPLLLMGLLALLSYWVLRQSTWAVPESRVTKEQEGPDYVMRNFAFRSYHPDGRLKSEIMGSEARHYPSSGELHIEQATLKTFDLHGRQTRAEAQQLVTDDAQQLYQLEGQVRLVSMPPPEAHGRTTIFEGQELVVNTVDGTIVSSLPVNVRHGPDQLQADSLRYVDSNRTAWLQGRVKATLVARP